MTGPPDDRGDSPWAPDRVSLDKSSESGAAAEDGAGFDPYRFGAPETPVPPEYAPPGYRPPSGQDFDPYRFGAPETPVPPEYAPPGYRPPAQPQRPGSPPPPVNGPPGYAYPQPRTGNGKAIAAMVLGIASILLCWLSALDVVPVVLAVVLGILGLHDASANPRREGRGMAIAGIICGAVGGVLAIVLTVWFVHLANQCGGLNDQNSSQLKQCVQQHI